MLRTLACPAVLAVTANTPALAAKTDVVVLRNGDRLTGEVEQLERGRLSFKTDDMGTIEIEWDKLRSVTAAAEFDVDDLEGRRFVGSLEPGPLDGELRVVMVGTAAVMSLHDVVRIRRIRATLWRRLDGSVDLGASYTSASELFKLDAAATIGTESPGFEVFADATATVTTQPGADETRRSELSLSYVRRFPRRWVAVVSGRLEQNRELGFDLRSSATAGGGRYLVQGRQDRLLTGLGLSINREQPVEGETTTNVELAAMLMYDRFAYDFPKIDFSVGAAGFASLSDGGRWRLELDARIKRELVKDFYASLRGYESYDSEPATEDAARNDYGLTFSLGWSF